MSPIIKTKIITTGDEKINLTLSFLNSHKLMFNVTFMMFDMKYSGENCIYEKLRVIKEEIESENQTQNFCGKRAPFAITLSSGTMMKIINIKDISSAI